MLRNKIILSFIAILLLTALTFLKHQNQFEDDFLEFWTAVKENYAYFDKKHTDWDKVKSTYLPLAENAKNKDELITIL